MAFSTTERGRIRWFLGYTSRFYQVDSNLEQAMTAIDSEAETNIRTALGKLSSIETELDGARPRLKALEVGSIKLPGGVEISMLRSEGRRMAGQVASTLGVPVAHDVFSPGQGQKRLAW